MKKAPAPINISLRREYSALRTLRNRTRLIRTYKTPLLEIDPQMSFSGYGDFLDFDHLSHEKVTKIIQLFGGQWKKEYRDGRVDYTRTEPINGLILRCWGGEPPPHCRVVEETQTVPAIPAQTIKVRRVVCDGEPTPA